MSRKFSTLLIIIVLAVAVVAGVKWMRTPKVDTDGYQGVVLRNGIAYFGHLSNLRGKYAVLTDVYYLQTQQGVNTLNLIKFGTEPQGPKDTMYINRSEIVYFYNIDEKGELYNKIMMAKKQSGSAEGSSAGAKK